MCEEIFYVHKTFHSNYSTRRKPAEQKQFSLSAEAIGAQLYEEIRESGTEGTAPRRAAAAHRGVAAVHEDVVPTGKTDTYHITQCSAYGLSH